MLEDVICPSCGFRNAAGVTACASCNFPLEPLSSGAGRGERPASRAGQSLGGAADPIPGGPLRRPQRRAAPLQGQTVWLWLLFGTVAAGILVYTAIDATRKRNLAEPAPVAGSNTNQQAFADSARAALAADSTNVEAHVALGNVLYDTGNWDEAIVQYRAVLRLDSARVAPTVDLGVCYYNLGAAVQAEQLFHRALDIDPHQPIALFNLGIVSDRRGENAKALRYYRDALEYAPSAELKATITTAMQRMAQKSATGAPASRAAAGASGGK